MKLILYGKGCVMYNELLKLIIRLIKKQEFNHLELEEVTSVKRIANDGVYLLPTLRFGGKNLITGTVPNYESLENIVRSELNKI